MRDDVGLVGHEALRDEVAGLIIEALVIDDLTVADIDPQAPLFGDGLGLDSIDALELAFAIAQKYGFKLRSDDERNAGIFASLDALTRYIAENRTK
ncbi:MAG: phosphopantetheine-binding protein [Pseudomonadota bacterium]